MMSEVIQYVTSAPYFWHTMGATTASAVFLGAMLYNGDLRKLTKGLIAILPYTALLTATNLIRITDYLATDPGPHNLTAAWAGTMTIIYLTFFYILGLLFGVITTGLAHKRTAKAFC